jgi:hypothetical protein
VLFRAQKPDYLGKLSATALLTLLREDVGRFDVLFEDPVKSLFQIRPEFRTYLELEFEPGADAASRSLANAEAHPAVGGYWSQAARLLRIAGRIAEATAALEQCLASKPYRGRHADLAILAEHYSGAADWEKLEPVLAAQLVDRPGVLPTPRVYRMYAELLRERDVEKAREQIRLGLALPGAGFEDEVARLEALRAAIGGG